MFPTGIPKLDEFLGGGVPEGKTLVYYTEPGVEGSVFGMQTLYSILEKNKKGIYVTMAMDPKSVRGHFMEFGWDISRFEENFAIVDAYSALVGMRSDEKYVVEDPEDIDALDETISRAIEEFSGGAITWGSLSTVMDTAGEKEALERVEKWNKQMLLYDDVGIYTFTAWPYSEDTLKKIKEEMFNATVLISGVAERIIYGQYYALIKADWTQPPKKSIMFKVYRPGGIKAFIPKVLITGPFNAGKTTFVHALSTRAVSVDRLDTTVALDHGHIDHKGFTADIFGTPGQERFYPILKQLGGRAMGVFLIVDSTKPEEFPQAKKMLEETRTFGLPLVLAANKQDLEGALSPEEIRKRMELPESVPVVPTVATEKKGVFEAFETLIDKITG